MYTKFKMIFAVLDYDLASNSMFKLIMFLHLCYIVTVVIGQRLILSSCVVVTSSSACIPC